MSRAKVRFPRAASAAVVLAVEVVRLQGNPVHPGWAEVAGPMQQEEAEP